MDSQDPVQQPSEVVEGAPGQRWLDRHLWQIQPVRDVLVVLGVWGLLWLGQAISIVTVPLLLAILFAYLFEPVIQWAMRRAGMSRRWAVTSIIVSAFVLVVVPVALGVFVGVAQGLALTGRLAEKSEVVWRSVEAERTAERAQRHLQSIAGDDAPSPEDAPDPRTAAEMQRRIDQQREHVAEVRAEAELRRERVEDEGGAWLWIHDALVELDFEEGLGGAIVAVQEWAQANAQAIAVQATGLGAQAAGNTVRFLVGVVGLLFMIFLTLFFFYFLATGWVEFKDFAQRVLPEKNRERIIDLSIKFDRVINAFIRGRLTIAFIQAIIFTVGYFIIGVPAAFIIGPVVAILAIVPYLALVGVPVSIVLLWLENHTGVRGSLWWVVLAPVAIYAIGQLLDEYVLSPVIQGKATDMNTPAILFASIAGGVLFGVFGLLIAIPVAACIKILLVEVFWPQFKAWGEGKRKDFLPFGGG